eukprot:41777-Prorocentrum_minimum.AAC.1
MPKRDFFQGNWQPYLERALHLTPRYAGSLDGGRVVATSVVEVACGKRPGAANHNGKVRAPTPLGYRSCIVGQSCQPLGY